MITVVLIPISKVNFTHTCKFFHIIDNKHNMDLKAIFSGRYKKLDVRIKYRYRILKRWFQWRTKMTLIFFNKNLDINFLP